MFTISEWVEIFFLNTTDNTYALRKATAFNDKINDIYIRLCEATGSIQNIRAKQTRNLDEGAQIEILDHVVMCTTSLRTVTKLPVVSHKLVLKVF